MRIRWLIVKDMATINKVTNLIAGLPSRHSTPPYSVDFPFFYADSGKDTWTPFYSHGIHAELQAYFDAISDVDKIFQVYETDSIGWTNIIRPRTG